MEVDLKRKEPKVAGALALVLGPLGFLYLGWRYALAASVLFVGVILVVGFMLPVPSWLMWINLPVFAAIAYSILRETQ